jgi:hypothetical protein
VRPGLTLENFACESIADVAAEAQRIADTLDRSVGFTFNQVRCVALPGGKAETLAKMQQEAQRSQFVVCSDALRVDFEVEDDR